MFLKKLCTKGCELQTHDELTIVRLGSGCGALRHEDEELPLESRLRERGEVGERAGPCLPELLLLCTVEYREWEVWPLTSAGKPAQRNTNMISFLLIECKIPRSKTGMCGASSQKVTRSQK